jgi:glycosyltransferase involved in cell wall biosynthesis
MNVLLTHLHLDYPGGSETYTHALVQGLLGAGHRVTVLSPILGDVARRVRGLGAETVDELRKVPGHPDVLHCQHNVMALAARAWFRGAPLVYHSHGTVPLPEQPPSLDLNIQRYVAVSELVRRHLAGRGVPAGVIRVVENPVDVRRFAPMSELGARPRRALVLSSVIDRATLGVIEEACARSGIALDVVGLDRGRVWDVEGHMGRADIVFSLGRGAIEAMACGRAVFVYDVHGADGWVTPDTVDDIASCTFSGKRYRRRLTAEQLVEELDRYDPEMGRANRRIAEDRYSLEQHVPRILAIYREAAVDFSPRALELPAQEVEVALMVLRARLAEKDALIERVVGDGQRRADRERAEDEPAGLD